MKAELEEGIEQQKILQRKGIDFKERLLIDTELCLLKGICAL